VPEWTKGADCKKRQVAQKMDNKQKGNLAAASAIKYFVSAGYAVSIPMTDTAKYDLVVEQDGKFQAIQCKYAGYEGNQGLYSVPLYVSGGNRSAGNRRIKYQEHDFDLLYVLCANGREYVIPFEVIAGQTTVNVGRKHQWSKWEQYRLSGIGRNCSPTEESVGDNPSNSAKPMRDGNAEPSPSFGEGVET
jgi:hypothetical protein